MSKLHETSVIELASDPVSGIGGEIAPNNIGGVIIASKMLNIDPFESGAIQEMVNSLLRSASMGDDIVIESETMVEIIETVSSLYSINPSVAFRVLRQAMDVSGYPTREEFKDKSDLNRYNVLNTIRLSIAVCMYGTQMFYEDMEKDVYDFVSDTIMSPTFVSEHAEKVWDDLWDDFLEILWGDDLTVEEATDKLRKYN